MRALVPKHASKPPGFILSHHTQSVAGLRNSSVGDGRERHYADADRRGTAHVSIHVPLIPTKHQNITLFEQVNLFIESERELTALAAKVFPGSPCVRNAHKLRASGDRDPLNIQATSGIRQEFTDHNGPALALGEFVCTVVGRGGSRRGHELFDQHLESARQAHQYRQGGIG